MTNLYKALADFQQEVPVIHEGTKGYGYTYADLNSIFKVINPLLKKHGLGFTQLLEGTSIRTVIFHVKSGETIESFTEIPQDVNMKGMNQFQVMGSAITYYRRYSISAALGLVTDKDADAAGTEKPKITDKIIANFKKGVADGKADQVREQLKKYTVSKEQEEEIFESTK
jgi:hypothetical protein